MKAYEVESYYGLSPEEEANGRPLSQPFPPMTPYQLTRYRHRPTYAESLQGGSTRMPDFGMASDVSQYRAYAGGDTRFGRDYDADLAYREQWEADAANYNKAHDTRVPNLPPPPISVQDVQMARQRGGLGPGHAKTPGILRSALRGGEDYAPTERDLSQVPQFNPIKGAKTALGALGKGVGKVGGFLGDVFHPAFGEDNLTPWTGRERKAGVEDDKGEQAGQETGPDATAAEQVAPADEEVEALPRSKGGEAFDNAYKTATDSGENFFMYRGKPFMTGNVPAEWTAGMESGEFTIDSINAFERWSNSDPGLPSSPSDAGIPTPQPMGTESNVGDPSPSAEGSLSFEDYFAAYPEKVIQGYQDIPTLRSSRYIPYSDEWVRERQAEGTWEDMQGDGGPASYVARAFSPAEANPFSSDLDNAAVLGVDWGMPVGALRAGGRAIKGGSLRGAFPRPPVRFRNPDGSPIVTAVERVVDPFTAGAVRGTAGRRAYTDQVDEALISTLDAADPTRRVGSQQSLW
jgi:hypothetical protein